MQSLADEIKANEQLYNGHISNVFLKPGNKDVNTVKEINEASRIFDERIISLKRELRSWAKLFQNIWKFILRNYKENKTYPCSTFELCLVIIQPLPMQVIVSLSFLFAFIVKNNKSVLRNIGMNCLFTNRRASSTCQIKDKHAIIPQKI